jgi:glucose-1-phosphate cytidylyltransferase
MKVAILAGGLGTRLAEETELRPKPMVEIGGHPILWHIMKGYAHFGLRSFVVALGYKGHVIKQYFHSYHLLTGNLSIDFATGEMTHDAEGREDWKVELVETGQHTNTGGRIRRLKPFIGNETFLATYGDGVANVDVGALVAFHKRHGRLATVTAVRPPARYGGLEFDPAAPERVQCFTEKPQVGEGWINGGFFVFEPGVFDYLNGDADSLEQQALTQLAADGQLVAFRHEGYWQCMDTLRDKIRLEEGWQSGRPPWRVWE